MATIAVTDLVNISATGYYYADYPTCLQYYQQVYQTIYGNDIYLGADSQDGQLVAAQAQAFYDAVQIGSQTYNSFSPLTATGDALSRNVKINGIYRDTATYSTVDLTISGTAGTVITNGQAIDTLNQIWNLPATVTIPMSGVIIATATAQNVGAVTAQANTVNKINTPTLGWQTVNNVNAATVGVAVQSDASLRREQYSSTSTPALSVFDSIIANVYALPGVSNVQGYENNTNATDANGIPAKSISLVVVGGVTSDIATKIAIVKTPGTGTYGTTSYTVYDKYNVPNTINFFRPTAATINVTVTIKALNGYVSSYAADIQNAIANYINALPIGSTVYQSKLFGYANLLNVNTTEGLTYNVTTITLGKNGGTQSTADVVLAFNEQAMTTASSIVVTVT